MPIPLPLLLVVAGGAALALSSRSSKPPAGGSRPSAGVGTGEITDPRPLTSADYAELASAAIYPGPMDNPQYRARIALLRDGPDTRDARVELLQIAQRACCWGLDGNPHAIAPDPTGSPSARWNYRSATILLAVVRVYTSRRLAPRAGNVRVQSLDILRWAKLAIELPDCGALAHEPGGDGGVSVGDTYARHDRSCTGERDQRFALLAHALESWRGAHGLSTPLPPWDAWPDEIPSWGSEADQAALLPMLGDALYQVGLRAMILWPGGPAPGQADQSGAAAATAIAIALAIAAAA